jgi:hypothetical protein
MSSDDRIFSICEAAVAAISRKRPCSRMSSDEGSDAHMSIEGTSETSTTSRRRRRRLTTLNGQKWEQSAKRFASSQKQHCWIEEQQSRVRKKLAGQTKKQSEQLAERTAKMLASMKERTTGRFCWIKEHQSSVRKKLAGQTKKQSEQSAELTAKMLASIKERTTGRFNEEHHWEQSAKRFASRQKYHCWIKEELSRAMKELAGQTKKQSEQTAEL